MGQPKSSSAFADDEGCDFNQKLGTENAMTGLKRDFAELDNNEEDINPTKKINASTGPVSNQATASLLNLQSSSEEQANTIVALKTSLSMTNLELDKWKIAFTDGSLLPSGINIDLAVVIQALRQLQASEKQLKEQLSNAKAREDMILLKLANTEQEVINLKAQQLLPDPVIYAEFTRMKNELEAAEKRVKELQDVAAAQFAPLSKHSRLLDAKCHTVLDENSEMGSEALQGKVDNEVRVICAPPPTPKVGRPKEVKEDEEEGEEGKKKWEDIEVETLIALRIEMEPEFVKNANKQGVDMWLKLQSRMSTSVPGFTRSSLACNRKFKSLIKQYKKSNNALGTTGEDRHKCKFYDSLDRWWQTNGTLMKHVTTIANDSNLPCANIDPAIETKEDVIKAKVIEKEEDEEGEEGRKNWVDSEVETLIALRREMEPEFVKNRGKQGADMWLNLQSRMMSSISGFARSGLACKRKFNSLIKQYKMGLRAKGLSGEDHECRLYDSLEQWWRAQGTILKHVTADNLELPVGNFDYGIETKEDGTNTPEDVVESKVEGMEVKQEGTEFNGECTESKGEGIKVDDGQGLTATSLRKHKKNIRHNIYGTFSTTSMAQMVENSTIMVSHFAKTSALLEKMDAHMDRLIDKL